MTGPAGAPADPLGAELRERHRPELPRGLGWLRSPRLLLLLLFLAVAVIAAAPGVAHLPSRFIADGSLPGYGEPTAGDHLQSTYRFWLVGHQLEHGRAPWKDPYSFQPLVPPQTVLLGWPWGIGFWPLDAAFGPVVAWNLLLLLSIALAGLATYGWLVGYGLARGPAVVGGVAFAIAPYRLAQSGGHLIGWAAVFVPASLWAFERARAAESRPARHLWGALSAVFLLSVTMSGQVNLALAALPFCLAYALLRWRPAATLWLAGGTAAAVALGLVIRRTIIDGSIAAGGRSLQQVELFQSDWIDLISRDRREGIEQFAYVGWLLPVAAAVGLVVLARRRPLLALLLLLSTAIPLLLAVGTNLPGYADLREVVSPLRFSRVPGRLLPVANLALAALAAIALAHVLTRFRLAGRRLVAALAIAVALVGADLLVFPLGANDAAPASAAYAELRDAPAGRILDLPYFTPGTHWGSPYDFYAMQTPRERPGGYSSVAPVAAYGPAPRLRRLNCGIWLPGDQRLLDSLGVAEVMFHTGPYGQARIGTAWFGWHGLQLAGYRSRTPGDGPVWLFRRGTGLPPLVAPVPEPGREQLVLCDGWYGYGTTLAQAGMWVYGEGPFSLTLSAPALATTTVWLDGARVDQLRLAASTPLRLQLAGERWHSIVLDTATGGSALPFTLRVTRVAMPGPSSG